MKDDYGRRPPRRRGGRPDRERGRRMRFDELDEDEYGDDYEDDEPPRRRRPPAGRRRPSARAPRGRGRAPRGREREGFFARLFGGGARRRGRGRPRGGFDWDEVDDSFGGDEPRYDEPPGPARRPRRPREGSESKTLMDLCTPVFGYAAILPHEPGAIHPPYDQFRQGVVAAIKAVEDQAVQHGIEPEDARQAAYALCFFMDEQVGLSEWSGREQWGGEPLGIMMQQDPEGGVNFFRRLDNFGEREKAVKEVFLVCLALGFRGMLAEREATERDAEIGRIRQKLVRSIHPTPMDKLPQLFPLGYREAGFIEEEVPPPPRWWSVASMTTVAVALLLYVLMWWWAGQQPKDADGALKGVLPGPAPSSELAPALSPDRGGRRG